MDCFLDMAPSYLYSRCLQSEEAETWVLRELGPRRTPLASFSWQHKLVQGPQLVALECLNKEKNKKQIKKYKKQLEKYSLPPIEIDLENEY